MMVVCCKCGKEYKSDGEGVLANIGLCDRCYDFPRRFDCFLCVEESDSDGFLQLGATYMVDLVQGEGRKKTVRLFGSDRWFPLEKFRFYRRGRKKSSI